MCFSSLEQAPTLPDAVHSAPGHMGGEKNWNDQTRLQLTAKCKCCQNKRQNSARFLYKPPSSFGSPGASTSGTIADPPPYTPPPPDLISTWHDLSVKRGLFTLACRQGFPLLMEDHLSRLKEQWSSFIQSKSLSRRHEISPVQFTPMRNDLCRKSVKSATAAEHKHLSVYLLLITPREIHNMPTQTVV